MLTREELKDAIASMSEEELNDFVNSASEEELGQLEELLGEAASEDEKDVDVADKATEDILYEVAEAVAEALLKGEVNPEDLKEALGEDYDKIVKLIEPDLLEKKKPDEKEKSSDKKEKNTLAQTLAELKI